MHAQAQQTSKEELANTSFQQGYRALLLAVVCVTGCDSKEQSKPNSNHSAPPIAQVELRPDARQSPLESRYFFKPPVIAPEEFSIVTASPGGFTKGQAFYLNNAAYFVKCTIPADRKDLIEAFEKVRFAPFSPEMQTTDIPGAGGGAFGLYKNNTIHINTDSPDFSTSSRAFFPLARTVAHEFCHHIAGDKDIDNIGIDATPLFKMEIVAYQRTQLFGKMARNFIEKIESASDENRQLWLREVDISTLYAKAAEVRYQVRLDVCQRILSLVDETGTTLRKSGVLTDDLDHAVGGLMVLASRLRDAAENGEEELAGYRVLTQETGNFASQIAPLNKAQSKKLQDSLRDMPELLLKQEEMLLELAATRLPVSK